MDDLLREFLTETGESLDLVDVELVRFEQEPNNVKILENIFRLVHTIKGTCGFLALPRLEALTHAAETLMSDFRAGRPVTAGAVSLVLATIDRIKSLLDALERHQAEPEGNDGDLIALLRDAAGDVAAAGAVSQRVGAQEVGAGKIAAAMAPAADADTGVPAAASSAPVGSEEDRADGKVAGSSIRVHVTTLDRLMTMVSELVLTRNQLIEIARRHQESEFKNPLQRLSHVTAELQEGVLKARMQPIGSCRESCATCRPISRNRSTLKCTGPIPSSIDRCLS
jgi:two-component system, chemotaxis family, sensor kinase CheA